ncbi:MAG: DsbA family protein [Gemmatimonadaceae bacterium]|nr:DsbA family protein [Gemmatimonadaceae bacterium]
MSVQVRKQGGNGKFLGLLAVVGLAGAAFIGYTVTNKPPAPPPVMPVPGDTLLAKQARGYTVGKADAPVEVWEFADFECPTCGRVGVLMEPDIRKNYIETGKIRFTFYDYPLVNAHPNTMPAHNAAACADDQGKFWPLHDRLLEGQAEWNGMVTKSPRKVIAGYAEQLGLDMGKWNACMDASTHEGRIRANYAFGLTQQVAGTPTFYVDGRAVPGVPSYDQLARIIEDAIAARQNAARPIPSAATQ